MKIRTALLTIAITVLGVSLPAAADGAPSPGGGIPVGAETAAALRLDPPAAVAPDDSMCPDLYQVAVDNWPGAEEDWPILDHIFWRENRCGRYPKFWVNRFGCVGIMQVCTGNFKRLGVNREVLKDFAVNIATGYRLCQEWVVRGRSCWRPWWYGRWRP